MPNLNNDMCQHVVGLNNEMIKMQIYIHIKIIILL
jgi:hypothetical protein